MEPKIRYVRTADGVGLAYCTSGAGQPLVSIPLFPFTHLQMHWGLGPCRHLYERLGARRLLVQYDGRGSGLSSRAVTDLSLEAQERDLEVLIGHLHLNDLALFAPFHAAPVALAYAAHHPERVSRLVLWCAPVRGRDYLRTPLFSALFGLMELDQELYTETAAHAWFGWAEGEVAHQAALALDVCATTEVVRSVFDSLRDMDVTPLLQLVRAPVLLLHRPGFRIADIAWARELSSGLPNARLLLTDGTSGSLAMGDMDQVLAAIDDFLREDEQITAIAAPSGLSGREVEVLRLLAGGCSNKEIARQLCLSPHTVERHIVNIYRKIDARGRADATAYALHHGVT